MENAGLWNVEQAFAAGPDPEAEIVVVIIEKEAFIKATQAPKQREVADEGRPIEELDLGNLIGRRLYSIRLSAVPNIRRRPELLPFALNLDGRTEGSVTRMLSYGLLNPGDCIRSQYRIRI